MNINALDTHAEIDNIVIRSENVTHSEFCELFTRWPAAVDG